MTLILSCFSTDHSSGTQPLPRSVPWLWGALGGARVWVQMLTLLRLRRGKHLTSARGSALAANSEHWPWAVWAGELMPWSPSHGLWSPRALTITCRSFPGLGE